MSRLPLAGSNGEQFEPTERTANMSAIRDELLCGWSVRHNSASHGIIMYARTGSPANSFPLVGNPVTVGPHRLRVQARMPLHQSSQSVYSAESRRPADGPVSALTASGGRHPAARSSIACSHSWTWNHSASAMRWSRIGARIFHVRLDCRNASPSLRSGVLASLCFRIRRFHCWPPFRLVVFPPYTDVCLQE
jgi:hypothetical protein